MYTQSPRAAGLMIYISGRLWVAVLQLLCYTFLVRVKLWLYIWCGLWVLLWVFDMMYLLLCYLEYYGDSKIITAISYLKLTIKTHTSHKQLKLKDYIHSAAGSSIMSVIYDVTVMILLRTLYNNWSPQWKALSLKIGYKTWFAKAQKKSAFSKIDILYHCYLIASCHSCQDDIFDTFLL